MTPETLSTRTLHIYLPNLNGGGAERLHVALAPAFMQANLSVTFLLNKSAGELLSQVPEKCRIETLHVNRQLDALPKLVSHLRRSTPDFLLVNMEHMNIISLIAKKLARSKTRIIVVQHNTLSEQVRVRKNWRFRVLPFLYKCFLPWADRIVAVSNGVAKDLSDTCSIDRSRISVIYNGVVGPDHTRRLDAPTRHQWFDDQLPVVLAVGRLVEQKDYPTLLRAFAAVARQRRLRLLILGEGPLRAELTTLAGNLGITDSIDMPGFEDNPLPFMKRARALVLTSQFEGFGNVLVEALACGTPVISTNCPHGPAEILNWGEFGELVPVGSVEQLAEAIIRTLEKVPNSKSLRARADVFSVASCAQSYISLMQ